MKKQMIFNGFSKRFSTKNEDQYNSIGRFWDYMSELYGVENLVGLGYNWDKDSIEYIIGLRSNDIMTKPLTGEFSDAVWKEVSIPYIGWEIYEGVVGTLKETYDAIYDEYKYDTETDGPDDETKNAIDYEIEYFDENGNFEIHIHRNKAYLNIGGYYYG